MLGDFVGDSQFYITVDGDLKQMQTANRIGASKRIGKTARSFTDVKRRPLTPNACTSPMKSGALRTANSG
ncbi:hypothetical protein [Mesorhizobium sp. M0047]|uniref:hypothetical protein n=1 Tax=Mesorhizobium sp. M0047 TaxID=2956859 RepID=UPI00333B2F52